MAKLVGKTFQRCGRIFIERHCNLHQSYQKHITSCLSLVPRVLFHMSSRRPDLNEFFDSKENWGEPKVIAGRPYRPDELRIKSNTDLHKLWYVLLKERNMLMTMEGEYRNQGELFPNPERLEKTEESMENILDVVAERNRAYDLLETGKPSEPGKRWAYNELGLGYWQNEMEHYIPLHMNTTYKERTKLAGPWQNKYLRLWREQEINKKAKQLRKQRRYRSMLQEKFPDAEID